MLLCNDQGKGKTSRDLTLDSNFLDDSLNPCILDGILMQTFMRPTVIANDRPDKE